jgi:hypothetical protein
MCEKSAPPLEGLLIAVVLKHVCVVQDRADDP